MFLKTFLNIYLALLAFQRATPPGWPGECQLAEFSEVVAHFVMSFMSSSRKCFSKKSQRWGFALEEPKAWRSRSWFRLLSEVRVLSKAFRILLHSFSKGFCKSWKTRARSILTVEIAVQKVIGVGGHRLMTVGLMTWWLMADGSLRPWGTFLMNWRGHGWSAVRSYPKRAVLAGLGSWRWYKSVQWPADEQWEGIPGVCSVQKLLKQGTDPQDLWTHCCGGYITALGIKQLSNAVIHPVSWYHWVITSFQLSRVTFFGTGNQPQYLPFARQGVMLLSYNSQGYIFKLKFSFY